MKVYCAETGGVKEIMKVYCAAHHNLAEKKFNKFIMKLPQFNILISFFYQEDIELYLPIAKNILVDSGAFTLQKNKNPDYETFFKKYSRFVKKHHENNKIQGFFELDIPEQVGYNVVEYYRSVLFDITDNIIPVWHKMLGVTEFKRLCDEYNYIGVSCVNDRSIHKQDYIKFVKYAHQHGTKIHGLGMLRPSILNKVPFDSVDGTGWFKAPRYGKRKNKKINSDYIKKNRINLTFLELMDHIQFQEKMYKKWRNYHND